MVKCPKGTPSQIRANYLQFLKPESIWENELFFNEGEGEKSETSEEFDVDSIRADKRGRVTPRDDLVYFFINCILEVLIESWDGKPCSKPKLGDPGALSTNQSEEYGELYPCEYPSTLTIDYLRDVYSRRSVSLSKDRPLLTLKTSDSNDSGEREITGEEYGWATVSDPWKPSPDEDVHIVFTNGAWYKGRVSRKLMDGQGTYFWEDGTSFTGEFIGGHATGKGRLDFRSQSVYEGGVYKAFRHGEGIHCLYDSPVMYTGQWWLGKKHGEGLIVYIDPSKGQDFYRGQWKDGFKEGFGYRQYPSGSKYIGYWKNGMRHGNGFMIWSNNDIYRGEWKEGKMNGYGEYTWNAFINKTLSYPATNTYRGLWSEGKRYGHGVLETISGYIVETNWINDVKEGPGKVICINNTVISSNNLFCKDKQAAKNEDDSDTIGLQLKNQNLPKRPKAKEKHERNLTAHLTAVSKAKFISIPVYSSVSTLDLMSHLLRFKKHMDEFCGQKSDTHEQLPIKKKLTNKPPKLLGKETCGKKILSLSMEDIAEEEIFLKNAITSRISKLKACYNSYATMACEQPPPFKCVLLRLFMWQMLIDCDIPKTNFSLVDIDRLLAEEHHLLFNTIHNPFEQIRFGQYVHIVILLSWHLYGKYIFSNKFVPDEPKILNFIEHHNNSDFARILAMTFNYFVDNDLSKSLKKKSNERKEKTFLESDIAPMESLYLIYCKLGEPHSARTFLTSFCPENYLQKRDPDIVKYFEKLPHCLITGKNAITIGGKLEYIPSPLPFNFPEIMSVETDHSEDELLCFSELTATNIVDCLMKACPGIESDGVLVNINHQLTFLEFFNALIFCTEAGLKSLVIKSRKNETVNAKKRKSEEAKKIHSDQEKFKETRQVGSSKKSRQVPETGRNGKN